MKVKMIDLEYDGNFVIVLDDKQISSFCNDDNIGETYYNVKSLLEGLGLG